jgi:hypothetical protein
MAQKSTTTEVQPSSSAVTKKTEAIASNAMTPAELTQKLSSNPRFKRLKPSGTAYIFVGGKLSA